MLVAAAACSARGSQNAPKGRAAEPEPADAGDEATSAPDSGGTDIQIEAGAEPAPLGDSVVTYGDVPVDVEELFAGAEPGAGSGPTLVYPTNGTMFPPNIARVLFQWQATTGTLFQLRFATPTGTLDVYTDGVDETCTAATADGSCWESDAESLLPYLEASAGQSVTLTLRALEPGTPGKVWESAPTTLHVGPAAVSGAIYYWSTTAQGIRRGTLDGRDAADFFTPPLANDQCVACHTLSRSGKRMSVAFPGDLLGVVDVVETVPPPVVYGPPPYAGSHVAASWATFSPDDSKVVVSGLGALSLLDAETAAPVGAGLIPLPDGVYGSMPDWSPDGQHLVFAAVTSGEKARHLRSSSIAWLSVEGDSFSGYELVAESTRPSCGDGTESYANPMFSPDSQWLAFSRADCESENDPTAQVVLARAEPDAEQIELVLANTQVGDQALQNLQNGMPTWAPTVEGNIAWIAFTSTRDYGLVLKGDGVTGTAPRQLWVAAVDLAAVGQGDPSYPAFRLPAQDLNENNHRPFWAVDVLPPDWVPPVVK
ncbi:MAG TPA: hypothetical protein VM686_39820 [Polyangiaceae bacterium]|nr:hypothetical protein [Polyangiaceae bacterium]